MPVHLGMRWIAGAFVLLSTILLGSCVSEMRIGRILYDPVRYENRDVRIRGVVTGSVNAFVGGGYRVDDGSGVMTVISSGPPPRRGTRVDVRGRVQSGVSIAGRSFGTTLRERDRHVHY